MDDKKAITTMREVVKGLSHVMDLINEDVHEHHQKVAYLAYRLAEEMKLPDHACQMALFGGLLHDIGAVIEPANKSLREIEAHAGQLALAGESILRFIPSDAPIAEVIRYTQTPYRKLELSFQQMSEKIGEIAEGNARIAGKLRHIAEEKGIYSGLEHDETEARLGSDAVMPDWLKAICEEYGSEAAADAEAIAYESIKKAAGFGAAAGEKILDAAQSVVRGIREKHRPEAAPLQLEGVPEDIMDAVSEAHPGLMQHGNAASPDLLTRIIMPKVIGQIVHLADVATLCFGGEGSVLNQVKEVRDILHRFPDGYFHPKALKAFDSLCSRESIWLDLLYQPLEFINFIPDNQPVTLEKMAMISEFASIIIDFRSPFTAMHSAGVSATAVELARLMGMSGEECLMMKIAGNVHDIGKLKIPKEILEKPGKLTDEEFNIIKEHSYYTYTILSRIRGLEQITEWAAFHHEKLNGRGYPFHLPAESIHLGARILTVADIFSAITEDRPYRKGMEPERVKAVMRDSVEKGELSDTIVNVLLTHYDEINAAREEASRLAGRRYYDSIEASRDTLGASAPMAAGS